MKENKTATEQYPISKKNFDRIFLVKLNGLFATIYNSKFNDFENFHEYNETIVNAKIKYIKLKNF